MPDTPPEAPRASRLGTELFLVYFALYAGFVYLAAFRADLMATKPFGGVNLAVWYGMALIVSPLLLALVYLLANRKKKGDQ